MVASSDDSIWLSPKWLVLAVALTCDGLLISFDTRLGMAATALLLVVFAGWFYIALRYGSLSGAPSGRNALVARVREQSSNRRAAMTSGAQQSPDPHESA
jgi:hypothetical protein